MSTPFQPPGTQFPDEPDFLFEKYLLGTASRMAEDAPAGIGGNR
jgi:hypothetical protein